MAHQEVADMFQCTKWLLLRAEVVGVVFLHHNRFAQVNELFALLGTQTLALHQIGDEIHQRLGAMLSDHVSGGEDKSEPSLLQAVTRGCTY